MQSFKPECTIYLALAQRGRPEKFSFACVFQRANESILSFSKYAGGAKKEETLMRVIVTALEQVVLLKQEKVEFRLSPGIGSEYLEERRSAFRDPGVQSMYEKSQELVRQIRLFRVVQVPAEQMKEAMSLAQNLLRG